MLDKANPQIKSFSDEVVRQAWVAASGRCERCLKQLSVENRDRESRGKWTAHSRSRRYLDAPHDCMILCWECHKATY